MPASQRRRCKGGNWRRTAPAARSRGGSPQSDTPTLDRFGTDLTAIAREGEVDPVVGRAQEIEQTDRDAQPPDEEQPGARRRGGRGKTAIVEGIASGSSTAGARHAARQAPGRSTWRHGRRDQVPRRLRGAARRRSSRRSARARRSDRLHRRAAHGRRGRGRRGSMDAANMLKPALARGELHVIGATTLDEYRKTSRRTRRSSAASSRSLIGEPSVRGDDRDPAGPARRYEAITTVRVHRRGAGRGGGAVGPLHQRPLPAGQGDRPHRPGGRPGPAADQDPGAGHARGRAAS